jgi:hypothetical protein
MTLAEVATAAGISHRNVRFYVEAGRVEAVRASDVRTGGDSNIWLLHKDVAKPFIQERIEAKRRREGSNASNRIRAAGRGFTATIDKIVAAARCGAISVPQARQLVLADDPAHAWRTKDSFLAEEETHEFFAELMSSAA